MAITGRQAMLVFTGGVDVIAGIVLIILGAESVFVFDHGAVGVAMWGGIGFIMIGMGNIISVLTSSKKPKTKPMIINLGSLMLNLTGLILAVLVISFYTWGAYDILEFGAICTRKTATGVEYCDAIAIFTTVILLAAIILITSMITMFMDCCSYALFGIGEPGDYPGPPPRPHTGMYAYDGPYGAPPHSYKQ